MWLDVDRSRLIQILNNLLSNASKYSPENSGLQLKVSVDVEILTVEFIDSGLGISEDDLEGECSTRCSLETRQEQGTGIGLSVVKTLVELHKGQIDIKSTLGHGTSVSFVRPCVIEARYPHLRPRQLTPWPEPSSDHTATAVVVPGDCAEARP